MVFPQVAIMALITLPVKAWDELMGDLSDEHPNQWAPPQGQVCQYFLKMGRVSLMPCVECMAGSLLSQAW
jgi:hypothetical protein